MKKKFFFLSFLLPKYRRLVVEYTYKYLLRSLFSTWSNPRHSFLQLVTSAATRGKQRSKTTICLSNEKLHDTPQRRKDRPSLRSPMISSYAVPTETRFTWRASIYRSRGNVKVPDVISSWNAIRPTFPPPGRLPWKTWREPSAIERAEKLGQVQISWHVRRPRGNRSGKSSRGAWRFCDPFVWERKVNLILFVEFNTVAPIFFFFFFFNEFNSDEVDYEWRKKKIYRNLGKK